MSNDPKRNPDETPEPPPSPIEDDISVKTPELDLGTSDDEGEPDALAVNPPPQDTVEPMPESEPEGWLDDLPERDESAILEVDSADAEQDPATDWDEPQRSQSIDEREWNELEDERQTLPPGRVLVGWREFVSLPQLNQKNVIACFDTTTAVSTIAADIVGVQQGRVTLDIGGVQGEVPGAIAAGGVFVEITTKLAGVTRSIQCQVVDPGSPQRMVFGRDAMEGYVVVDVALSFLHRRVGSPDTGQG